MDHKTVLQIVSNWTPAQRMVLLQDVLSTLVADAEAARPKRPSADIALGRLATGRPAPSAGEVEQWLEAHRAEKYG